MKLIIVGNGFDCAQRENITNYKEKFDTSYKNFGKYLKTKESGLIDLLNTICEEYDANEDEYWYQFEERLGNPDLANLQDDLDIERDFIKRMYDVYDDDSATETVEWSQVEGFRKIKYHFCKWLKEREQNLKQLHNEGYVNKLILMNSFVDEDIFLNFNYTNTIELIYGLCNVYHIHGDIEECNRISEASNNSDIVLGHKYKKSTLRKSFYEDVNNSIKRIEKEYSELFDKNCDDIIEEDKTSFFSLLDEEKNNIEEVYVLGHSIEDVDIDYFSKIIEVLGDDVKWIVSDFKGDSLAKKERLLKINSNLKIDDCIIE